GAAVREPPLGLDLTAARTTVGAGVMDPGGYGAHRLTLRRAVAALPGSISVPSQRRPVALHAAGIAPPPANRSTTRAPGRVGRAVQYVAPRASWPHSWYCLSRPPPSTKSLAHLRSAVTADRLANTRTGFQSFQTRRIQIGPCPPV